MRNLLLFLLALVGVFWVRRALRRRGDDAPAAGADTPAPPPAAEAERMLPCAHCGVHVPQSEAVPGGGRYYCCEEHRRLGDAS